MNSLFWWLWRVFSLQNPSLRGDLCQATSSSKASLPHAVRHPAASCCPQWPRSGVCCRDGNCIQLLFCETTVWKWGRWRPTPPSGTKVAGGAAGWPHAEPPLPLLPFSSCPANERGETCKFASDRHGLLRIDPGLFLQSHTKFFEIKVSTYSTYYVLTLTTLKTSI